MGKKNEEVRSKNEEVVYEAPEVLQEAPEVVQENEELPETGTDPQAVQSPDKSLVWDLSSLFEMKFRDPLNGQVVMVRRAFKPRGKLEFYCPEK